MAPKIMPQRQGGVHRRGGTEKDQVTADRAGVVIQDHRQPGAGGGTVGVPNEEVECGVIGLPGGIGPLGPVSPDQLEGVPVGHWPLVGEGEQARIQVTDDRADGAGGDGVPALFGGDRIGPAGDRRSCQPWSDQGQPLDQGMEFRMDPSPPGCWLDRG
ncbi:hypothetical protein [Corynebacterium atrinae]|uniref:hypothetical protein n=1 Tax=Corynebacterium atrinae TaxID=1336740 RepID=UPI0025B5A7E2|nr:hypothetical protein [Corynebacterium atrinae]